MMAYFQWDPYQQSSVKFQPKYNDLPKKDEVENVACKIAAILSGPPCVYWLV